MNRPKSTNPLRKAAIIFIAAMQTACAIHATEYDSIAAKYKNENAVIINYNRRLVIKNENGKLVATSYITKEKLLISDLSPGIYNTDYLYHSDFNKLINLTATASLPEKTGYKKVPCYNFSDVNPERDNVFYDDSRYKVVSYSGLLKNSLTETKYAIEHTDLNMLPPFSFQESIPVASATFEITVPKYVNIRFVIKGIDTAWIKRTKEENNNTITYRFSATDIPPYKEYDNVPSVWYYLPHVVPYIASYQVPGADKPSHMLANADDLYKYLYKYIRNVNMLDDPALADTVTMLTKNDASPQDKAAHIYQWVQKSMHYVAFEQGLEGFVPREASLIMKRKYGDCKDMTSILVTMCRKAGLNAYFTWIGTREKPYRIEEIPLPIVNNHMICALKTGDEWIFMDGTHPLIPFGQNPEGIQGKEAMIAIDANNYKIITIPVTPADKNITTDSTSINIDGNNVKGTIRLDLKGYKAWEAGLMMMYHKNDDRDKAIKAFTRRGSDKYRQIRYDILASCKGNKEVSVTADFAIDDYVQKAGNQYYINMNVKRTFEDKQVETGGRKVPCYFDYKEKIKEVVSLYIPKGYHIAHIPSSAHGSVDGLWNYSISYKTDNKKIILIKQYELNTLIENPGQFDDNNKMVDDLKKQYKESVVLAAN